jgi:hypothetical protein
MGITLMRKLQCSLLSMVAATVTLGTIGIGSAGATVIYSTGFESPTFTPGLLAGQDGWLEFPAASAAVQVENSFAKTGAQAVDVIPALAAGQDGAVKTVTTTAPIVEQSADIWLSSSSTQSEWQYAAVGLGLVGFAGGFNVLPNDTIQLITSGFTSVGTWTRDSWVHVDLTLDYLTQTYALALNNVAVANNVPFCGDNGPCLGSNVAAYADGFFDVFGGTTNVNDIGFMDNYSVSSISSVPEISTWAMLLLGFGGLGFAGYRRSGATGRTMFVA